MIWQSKINLQVPKVEENKKSDWKLKVDKIKTKKLKIVKNPQKKEEPSNDIVKPIQLG